jgi:hypothetical protein
MVPADEDPRWDFPPRSVMPGLVPERLVLLSGPTVAAWVESFRAWTQGLEFDLCVATAPDAVARNDYGGLAIEFDRRSEKKADLFELGISTGGQETSNASAATWPGRHMEPTELMLQPQNGGGGDAENGGYWRITWWLTPLPTTGPVEFWCRWEGGGIARSSATINATTLTRAASDASPLWTAPPPN